MTQAIHTTITDEIRSLCRLEREVQSAEESLSDLKALLRTQEQRVIDKMIDEEVSKVEVDGRSYKTDTDVHVVPEAECSDQVVEWIKNNGGADKVKPTMHWKSRNVFLDEVLIDDDGVAHIPDELVGLVKVNEFPTLVKRKVG